jgi:hypothetical protein
MELLELVDIANAADLAKDDQCPFCHKQPIGHATKKPKKVNDKVTSVPSALKCDIKRRGDGEYPYTTAQHHLISAMQCYAKIRRLVRMGNMVGYDINNPTNGIGLPTTHPSLTYSELGVKKKYGDLDDPDGKRSVSFALMKELKAQWHVGHHAFEITVSGKDIDSWMDEGADEKDGADYAHETQYDVLIIGRLFNLVKSIPPTMCEEPRRDDDLKQQMDKISNEIREHLDKFNEKNGAKPAQSSPFFVSMRAYEYSGVADTLPKNTHLLTPMVSL